MDVAIAANDSAPQPREVKTSPIESQSGFRDDELPARIVKKPSIKQMADQALVLWGQKKYGSAVENCRSFATAARLKKEEIAQITDLAENLNASSNFKKAAVLHFIALSAQKYSNKAVANDIIGRTYRIATILTVDHPAEAERAFAASLIEEGMQARKIGGGVPDADAPIVLLYSRLQFSLKQWQSAIKEYEYWLAIFESRGKSPPEKDLPDALAEVGMAYTSLKIFNKAESSFRRACETSVAVNGTTITPINQYDVEDFLIYNLLTQTKLEEARELAHEHLKFKEKTLGLRSPELAKELNRYADLFEQAGETAFSFSLRARAGRVVNPD